MAKGQAKKHVRAKPVEGKRPWRRLPRFAWISIAVILAVAGVLAGVYGVGRSSPGYAGPPRAAIVDQLYNLQPNEALIAELTGELEDYGFQVDLYQGDEITVDFYRQLPVHGHRLIIFRSHSGLILENDELIEETLLFTNEKYSKTKHIGDQVAGRVAVSRITERDPLVFVVGPEFVTQSMAQVFDDTVIIMMGCSCIYIPDLAQAFVDKGASAYLAWDASVDLHYVDEATPYLLRQLCSGGLTIQQAVARTMDTEEGIGPDPEYKAVLKYYPAEQGHKTLAELLGRVK